MEHDIMTSKEIEKHWAIVELMGHSQIAGEISEYNLGGTFVRIDVPKSNGFAAFTKLVTQQAIYAVNFVDRDVALAAVEKLRIRPVTPYSIGSLTSDAVRQRLEHANMPDDDYEPY